MYLRGFGVCSSVGAYLFAIPSCNVRPGYETRLCASSDEKQGNVERMLEQAQKLREEVQAFNQVKQDAIDEEVRRKNEVLDEKQNKRMRYSVEVPILKGNGNEVVERVDFPALSVNGENSSFIYSVQADLPLGMILGEVDAMPVLRVDEIADDSNAAAAGIKVGDLLRACTATQTTMETPTWQLLAGGIGQPKTKRFMYSADRRPFEEIMDAIASNRQDPKGRPAVLVFERLE